MPRQKFTPSEAQRNLVKSMAACGITHEMIAQRIRIRSPKTLRKHFRSELDSGVTEANYEIAKSLFNKGKNGDVEAQKFWLKCRAGWSEYPHFAPASASLPAFVVAQDNGVQQP